MENLKNHYKNVIFFTIGSKNYQLLNKTNFLLSLQILNPILVIKIMSKLHILSLFINVVTKTSIYRKYRQFFQSYIFYQKYLNTIISSEIINLTSKKCKNLNPIILKGPAFWEDFYKYKFLRRVEDIDLLLQNEKHVIDICHTLESIGYINIEPDYKSKLNNTEHYELPFFKKEIKRIFNKEKSKLLDFVIEFFRPSILRKIENLQFGFLIKIEIHKCIFKFKNKDLIPSLLPNDVKYSKIFPNCKIMRNHSNLPYLSLKLISDLHEYLYGKGSPKFLKLLVDFIRIIQSSSYRDIRSSILLANKWNVKSHYIETLNYVKNFTPEITYISLSETNIRDELNLYIDKLLDNELTFYNK